MEVKKYVLLLWQGLCGNRSGESLINTHGYYYSDYTIVEVDASILSMQEDPDTGEIVDNIWIDSVNVNYERGLYSVTFQVGDLIITDMTNKIMYIVRFDNPNKIKWHSLIQENGNIIYR